MFNKNKVFEAKTEILSVKQGKLSLKTVEKPRIIFMQPYTNSNE